MQLKQIYAISMEAVRLVDNFLKHMWCHLFLQPITKPQKQNDAAFTEIDAEFTDVALFSNKVPL